MRCRSSQARLEAYTKSWLERKSQEDHEDLNKEKKKNKSKGKKPKEEEEEKKKKKKKKKKKRKAEGKTKKRKLSPETPPLKNHKAQDVVKGFHKEKIISSEAVQDAGVVIFKRFPNVKITSEAVQDDQDVVLRFEQGD